MIPWETAAEFYDHLTLHIVPGPRSFSYFVPFLLIVAALTASPQVLSRWQMQWLILPLVYAVQLYVWQRYQSFDVISMNGALLAFMLLGWYDVRQDFQYVRRLRPGGPVVKGSTNDMRRTSVEFGKGQAGRQNDTHKNLADHGSAFALDPYPPTLLARLRWIGLLLSSMRMTDWRIGLPSHDSRQPGPVKHFTDFVRETVVQAALAYVLLDLTTPYALASACPSAATGRPSATLLTQIFRSLVSLAYFYAALGLFTAFLPHLISICALTVAPSLRLDPMTSPLTWPGHFGPLSSIYSRSYASPSSNRGLRAFWGLFWHQNMRFITSTPGVALASLTGLRRGSKLRYMTIVISSFFWSGIVHMGVVPPIPVGTRYTCLEMRLRVASFFWAQCVGIGLEDAIESVCRAWRSNTASHRGIGGPMQEVMWGILKIPDFAGYMGVFLLQAGILLWTIGFLAATAWWTILPTACEMGWFDLKLLPASGLHLLARE